VRRSILLPANTPTRADPETDPRGSRGRFKAYAPDVDFAEKLVPVAWHDEQFPGVKTVVQRRLPGRAMRTQTARGAARSWV